MEDKSIKCKKCKYFVDSDKMECHRNPPVLILKNPSGAGWIKGWPTVSNTDWCGEFVDKAE